jgi:protein-L-isoaspartate(D-aspartate) O-methyltransferase
VIVGLRPVIVILALCSSATFTTPLLAADNGSLETRLASRGIRDTRVLEAFARVPRDVYVSASAAERRFDDKPLPANYSQVISQPYLLARMIELLQLKPDARVLEVGTGTGYAAAVLAELAGEVFSVGVIPESAAAARLRLAREGCQNVHVKLGDGALGWREYGPYDAIVVTTIGARVPTALIEQLVEGGVLVMAVGPPRGRQVLLRGVKKGFKLHAKEVAELQSGRDVSAAVKREPADQIREKRRPPNPDDSQIDR